MRIGRKNPVLCIFSPLKHCAGGVAPVRITARNEYIYQYSHAVEVSTCVRMTFNSRFLSARDLFGTVGRPKPVCKSGGRHGTSTSPAASRASQRTSYHDHSAIHTAHPVPAGPYHAKCTTQRSSERSLTTSANSSTTVYARRSPQIFGKVREAF